MATNTGLTAEYVRSLVSYDKETGEMRWLTEKSKKTKIGDIAGYQQKSGYMALKIDGRHYLQHRLAWLIETGEWPPIYIDHINNSKRDNRWENLRLADESQNSINVSLSRRSKTGVKHVSPAKGGMFIASVGKDMKYHQKIFPTIHAAKAWAISKTEELHGEFAHD